MSPAPRTPLVKQNHGGVAPPRDFVYIKPKRRRLSDYEAVSVYTQPDPEAGDKEGWFLRTPEGRPAWIRESTRLVHPHWFDFRDPNAHWQRTYVRMQAEQERSIERASEDATANGALAGMDAAWVHDVLAGHYRVWSYFEYGLFRAFAVAQREALSDTLGNALCFEGFDRMRHAQAIVLYLMDLEAAREDFTDDGAASKARWMEDPRYQPARALVERCMAFEDWAELAVATNLVIDPIVSQVGLSDLVRRPAPFAGDAVTALIISTVERDRRRNQAWTEELVRMVTAEGVPERVANHDVVQSWIDEWTPLAHDAATALLAGQADGEAWLAAAEATQAEMVGALGLRPAGASA